ncbi:response regulator transcription factor [Cohnella candidum]|uniref:DNA-binding response regulator n=1 Tax=Cohnella candidum TaxID=2674991 RepID=A0A3G3K2Z0_9BACL|nr:response regulator transcription factor [Cohnella candidum]AYQ74866.1 DNA-binding response regulator [Cohnella candidum]
MYRVLIVDDEPLIREGLKTIVDWEESGFEVVGTATDAMDALQKLPSCKPDLIIIDIRMPGMDGIQLMRTIQGQYRPSPRFLVLSGHADFDYARAALQMRADGYLLKPVDEDELIDHLVRLKRLMDEEDLADRQIVGKRIEQLLAGEERDIEAFDLTGWDRPAYEVLLVKLQNRTEIEASTVAHIKSRLMETFDASGSGTVFSMDPYLGILLGGTGTPAEEGRAHQAAYEGIAAACREYGVDFTAVSGGAVRDPREMGSSYRRALELMAHRFVYEGGRIHDREPQTDRESGFDRAVTEEKIYLALDLGNAEGVEALIREAGTAMLSSGMSETYIKTAFVQMMTNVIGKLAQSNPEFREKSETFSTELFDAYAEYRYYALLDRLCSLGAAMAGKLNAYGTDKQIRKLLDLIHRNYHENLKLETLAEVFNYNSSYLGKLLKNATGESFNTYLDKVRIGKAKEFLDQGMKVYQVAEKVGYSNVDYFHSKFRKYVGTSPSAYRKQSDGDL